MKEKFLEAYHYLLALPKLWYFAALGVVILIPVIFGTTSYVLHSSKQKLTEPKKVVKVIPTPTPTPSVTLAPTEANTDTNTGTTTSQTQTKTTTGTTPTPTTTQTTTSSSDTTPPTITTMTGPGNGETVTFSSFCFPIVASDNVSSSSNMQVKTQFDSASWTDWSSNFSPCFSNVSNGNHTFNAQVKDQAGNTSSVTSRTFTVATAQNINITVSGHLYADANCNNSRDAGETDIQNNSTTVNLFKMPEFSVYLSGNTDNNGQFSLSKSILSTDSVTLQVSPVAPSGYKFHATAPTVTLSQSNTSASVDIPFVPNADVGLCQ